MTVPLDFLDSGASCTTTIYADGTAGSTPHAPPTVLSTRTVTSGNGVHTQGEPHQPVPEFAGREL